MLNQVKLFFDQHMSPTASNHTSEENLRLASAALFIEMMYMDDKVHPQEYHQILKHLREQFYLDLEDAKELISSAIEQTKQATDYFQFTTLINKGFSQEQKVDLIKTLWKIAFADGSLDIYEEQMVRKIADLIHVPHSQFIKTKHFANKENLESK